MSKNKTARNSAGCNYWCVNWFLCLIHQYTYLSYRQMIDCKTHKINPINPMDCLSKPNRLLDIYQSSENLNHQHSKTHARETSVHNQRQYQTHFATSLGVICMSAFALGVRCKFSKPVSKSRRLKILPLDNGI